MPFSSSRMISSFFLRSCSQKNLASLKRARDHLLVAGDDGLAAVLRFQIGNEQEVVRQLLAVPQREAFLVRPHRARQALGRHGEERLVELSHQDRRPLGEAGVLGDKRVVLDEGELGLLRERVRAFVDGSRAARAVEDHLVALQGLLVVGEARDLERLVGEEAMPARRSAGLDAGDLERHHLAVEQEHDRMQRPDPAQLGAAGVIERPVEAHGLRPGKADDRFAQRLGDDLVRGAPRLVDARDVVVALLLVLDDLGVLDATPGPPP